MCVGHSGEIGGNDSEGVKTMVKCVCVGHSREVGERGGNV